MQLSCWGHQVEIDLFFEMTNHEETTSETQNGIIKAGCPEHSRKHCVVGYGVDSVVSKIWTNRDLILIARLIFAMVTTIALCRLCSLE